MARHPDWIHTVFTPLQLDEITRAVTEAEAETSAEIRVHIERRLPRSLLGRRPDPLDRARRLFTRLGMHRTAERHGVLLYLALGDRRLAILGDEGIHARVDDGYWDAVRDRMVQRLRDGAADRAVVAAVREIGAELARHFPRRPGDVNELSNEVSSQ
jgi:uncharacterized membrane protein